MEYEDSREVITYWNEKAYDSNIVLNEYGERVVSNCVKKYGAFSVRRAIDSLAKKHGLNSKDGFESALKELPLILFIKHQPPHVKQIAYIKGMCRNKYTDFREAIASKILKMFYDNNGDLNFLQDKIRYNEFCKWGHVEKFIYDYLELEDNG